MLSVWLYINKRAHSWLTFPCLVLSTEERSIQSSAKVHNTVAWKTNLGDFQWLSPIQGTYYSPVLLILPLNVSQRRNGPSHFLSPTHLQGHCMDDGSCSSVEGKQEFSLPFLPTVPPSFLPGMLLSHSCTCWVPEKYSLPMAFEGHQKRNT